MKRAWQFWRIAAAFFTFPLLAAGPSGFPFQSESLRYTINWPSGLSMGEATLTARQADGGWRFELSMDAGIPGYTISDNIQSSATANLCSLEMDRNTTHGSRKTNEKINFDYASGQGMRETANGGGKTSFSISSCAYDALDFVYFARRELGQGRVPPGEDVYFGPPYSVRLEYTGAQTIPVNGKRVETDHVAVDLKGPSSNASFEMFFARDAARTPLLIRVPFTLGTFSMELAH
jgi:Protein of unknown function (DUF3108)